jgi:hypothetical protein
MEKIIKKNHQAQQLMDNYFNAYKKINNDNYYLTIHHTHNSVGHLYIDEPFHDLNSKQITQLETIYPDKWKLLLDACEKYQNSHKEHLQINVTLKKQEYLVADVKRNILSFRGAQFGCINSWLNGKKLLDLNQDKIPDLIDPDEIGIIPNKLEIIYVLLQQCNSEPCNLQNLIYIAEYNLFDAKNEYYNSMLRYEQSLSTYDE